MTTVLRIDASTRLQNSLSRELADTFERCLAEAVPDLKILRRDLGQTPPFIICEAWVAAAFAPEDARTADQRKLLALSDTLIEEVAAADFILLSTPMYNYGMPAGLKAWVDQVVRIGKTFTFDLARGDRPLEPILSGKTLVLTTACGEFGFEAGEPNAAHNHLAPHVRTIGKYLGVEGMHHIAIEYQEFRDQRHADSVSSAHRQARELVERLTVACTSA
ncbi:NAD(P)H-dependent oxidoreductase [Labrenzia sp. CE80]|uniref:FMN-dependent NADH-azoreductase n=1 Tax=Labrenzia sp. CE80 TaxID=1788986 RepID=UPI00129ACCAB|nr:NAD(P)H-dependent oxidoreductase [Labrenzia sp. CE80]